MIKYIKQRALLVKLTVTPLLKKSEVFSGTPGFITLFRRTRHFVLTSTRLFQCTSSFMEVLFARADLSEESDDPHGTSGRPILLFFSWLSCPEGSKDIFLYSKRPHRL